MHHGKHSNSWSRIQDDGLFYKKKTYQPRQLGTMRKTRQPYLQASGGGRPTKVLSTHQFESRGSSDRQSAKVDIARTMLSMAGVSRPGTAQSAQPTSIIRSPFLRTRSDSPVLFPPLSTVRAANPACMTVTRASTFLALSRRGGDEVSMRANCFPAPTDHPTHHRGIYGGLSLYDSF